MSEWVVLVIAMALACAVVLAVVVLRQRRVSEDDDPSETPDVIEYMTMMVGVIYAIVLGLAVAGVWEARNAAQDDTFNEAQALHEVSARAGVYPAAVRDHVRADVQAYVSYVVHTEWRYMEEHQSLTPRGTQLLDRIRRDVMARTPRSELEIQTYQPMVDQVAAADAARSARGQNTGPTLPGVVWFGLIAGALITVGLIFTLQIRRSPRELLLAGVFSALIAFLLFLIWDFDDPFARGLSVTTQSFVDLFPSAGGHG
jgi:Na+/proline symporter